MPISGIGSWIPTIDEFLTHWAQANTALAPGELMLIGGYDRDQLVTDRAVLVALLADVETKLNIRQVASGDRDIKRANIRPRLIQFGPAVRGHLPDSRYIPALRRVPTFNSSPGVWRQAMDDQSNLWTTINTNFPPIAGFTPPLLLASGYTVALFNTERSALDAAFTAVTTADQNLQLAQQQRTQTFEPIYERLKQYRQVCVATFAPGHPLLDSLPRLTPAAGDTPAPVNLLGIWSVPDTAGKLDWTPSLDPDLDYYSIRYHPGPRYKADGEQVVTSVLPGTTTLLTTFGLVASGSVAWFKVYVVTTTGNEKGSNAVKVVRP